MRVCGVSNKGDIVLLEVSSAILKIFDKVIKFKTTAGDVWILPFESQTEARIKITHLMKTGELTLDSYNESTYMLRKDGE